MIQLAAFYIAFSPSQTHFSGEARGARTELQFGLSHREGHKSGKNREGIMTARAAAALIQYT